jgi:hypothetical protein
MFGNGVNSVSGLRSPLFSSCGEFSDASFEVFRLLTPSGVEFEKGAPRQAGMDEHARVPAKTSSPKSLAMAMLPARQRRKLSRMKAARVGGRKVQAFLSLLEPSFPSFIDREAFLPL